VGGVLRRQTAALAATPVLDATWIGQRTICQPGAGATVILAVRSRNSIDSRRRRGTLMGVQGRGLSCEKMDHSRPAGTIYAVQLCHPVPPEVTVQ
jgi:hypothetical protein